MIRRIALFALLTAALAHPSSAQGDLAAALASQVRTDVAVLASQPALATWQRSHAGKLELAHYETYKDPYQEDFRRLDRWCAASVGQSPAQVVRAALFYVPSVARDALPSLPEKEDATLTRACRMQAIWYETPAPAAMDAVVRELSSSWGQPNGQSTEPDIAGSGLWRRVVAWHRAGMNVWVVDNSKGQPDGTGGPRFIVYARRDIPRDPNFAVWLLSDAIVDRAAETAAQIAAQDSTLTAAVLSRSNCDTRPPGTEAESLTASRLARWLSGSSSLPPQRKAAALLLADSYVACARMFSQRLIQLGAKSGGPCSKDGPTYNHNFRDQAEKLDPQGPAGELAGLASLAAPCSLKGARPWPDLVVEKGERLLGAFPPDQWTPWVHFAIARAHAVKLSFAYPDHPPEDGSFPLTRAAMQRERRAAVERFERFIEQKPDAPESVFAWQEAWRLLAGLPPSQIHFGCGCE
jgi:hypothetical protein